MMEIPRERLLAEVRRQPYPLLFVTISGAHLYGFASPDSDYDLRGVHLSPLRQVLGLGETEDTIEVSRVVDGLEFDLVTHDAAKFFRLLLKPNGYVMEQLTSPLVLYSTPAHETLKAIGCDCLTRRHAHHYLGFARSQWQLFHKTEPRRIKPLLYVFRVLLTGIHLMETGEIEANLLRLNEKFNLSYLPELLARKAEAERASLPAGDETLYEKEYARLVAKLEQARDNSSLPENPSARPALNDLLLSLRLKGIAL